MAKEVKTVLLSVAQKMGLKFTFKSAPIKPEDVFSDTGLLPAFAKRADQLCQLCFGYGIGMKIEKLDTATLKKKVTFDDATPGTLRCLCLLDVLMEFKKTSMVGGSLSLDELQYE